jgi:hypothetical protein
MSGTGEARTYFAGEKRLFVIRLGEQGRIEKACGAGLGEVLRRVARCVMLLANHKNNPVAALAAGIEIHAADVTAVLVEGLRGAGMPEQEARRLVDAEVGDRGVRGQIEHASTALTVLWGTGEVPAEGKRKAGARGATPASR